MRSVIGILLLSLCLAANAARQRTHRMSDGTVLTFKTRTPKVNKVALYPYTDWDPQKKYKLPVILMSFADRDFAEGHDLEFYKNIFNKEGFNLHSGPGCVKEYFRDQSRGKFNVEFDVVGPVKVAAKQKVSNDLYGVSRMKEAIRTVASELNYRDYDWDGDGKAETVIVVFAGYGGNEKAEVANLCIWPSSDNLYGEDVGVEGYSASPELWTNDASCGIGTICHEFSHVIGLPDIYPVGSSEFSACDEWDLMDGGNFTDDGWCPPNYSIFERSLLGWQSPEELSASTSVTNMPSYDSTGLAYSISNSANVKEQYLLENRQWEGWDYMLPNHGLLVTYVDFNQDSWTTNSVNSSRSHHRYDYLHADGLDYNYFDALYKDISPYGEDGRNLRLKNTVYPYTDAEGVERTIPELFGKFVEGVREHEGLISFTFRNATDGISPVSDDATAVAYYDLQGRKLAARPSVGIYVIRYSNGTVKKMMR